MKKITVLAIAFTMASALIPGLANAAMMSFVSGANDGCKVGSTNCLLSSNDFGTWISETAFNAEAGSTGAEWVQADGSFTGSAINDYRVFELDLNKNGPWTITDLWLSVDDDVIIRSGGNVIWDSNDGSVSGNPWSQAINVTDIVGNIEIAANNRINFWVHDIGDGNGPTGIIFAGTTAVPEPAIIALFGLGLLGLGFARRKVQS